MSKDSTIREGNLSVRWINIAKFVAIIAVLVDHTHGVLYSNQYIAIASYFSVSLFVFLSGMTAYISNGRRAETWRENIFRYTKKIVVAYMVATLIYFVVLYRQFDLVLFLEYLIHFNISGPLYYVLLYLQLVIVGFPLYRFLKTMEKYGGKKYIYEITMLLTIVMVSIFTTNCTNILNAYGGGGKLFGGTYLILYYLGMLCAKHQVYNFKSTKKLVISGIIHLLLWYIWYSFVCEDRFLLDSKLPFGAGFNPPSISSIIMAILVCGVWYCISSLFEINDMLKKVLGFFSFLGKHTLEIFLYHRLFLDYVLVPYISVDNVWLKRFVYFSVMIFAPILLMYLMNKLKSLIERIITL